MMMEILALFIKIRELWTNSSRNKDELLSIWSLTSKVKLWKFRVLKLIVGIFQGAFQMEGQVDTIVEALVLTVCKKHSIKKYSIGFIS